MDYKTQYQMYLSQASAALEDACAKFLPEESEVCRAARYSLLGLSLIHISEPTRPY